VVVVVRDVGRGGGRESAPHPLRAFDAPVSAASWSSSRVVTPA
jgi:hypothetical protein